MQRTTTIGLHTGRQMPVIGLGTWQLTDDTAGTVADALTLGYRMIDTSGDDGTQTGIGAGIRRSGIDRDTLYLVTKVEETDDAYAKTLRARPAGCRVGRRPASERRRRARRRLLSGDFSWLSAPFP